MRNVWIIVFQSGINRLLRLDVVVSCRFRCMRIAIDPNSQFQSFTAQHLSDTSTPVFYKAIQYQFRAIHCVDGRIYRQIYHNIRYAAAACRRHGNMQANSNLIRQSPAEDIRLYTCTQAEQSTCKLARQHVDNVLHFVSIVRWLIAFLE